MSLLSVKQLLGYTFRLVLTFFDKRILNIFRELLFLFYLMNVLYQLWPQSD